MKNILYFISLAFTTVMVGCAPPVQEDVFILEGNLGNVILHETYQWGFDYSPVTFKLLYETNNERRLICEILGLYVPYTDPKPNEHYMYFRNGVPNGYNPIFVNPNEFSLSEYEDIKNTLKSNIAVIAEAVKTRKKGRKPISEDRRLKIGSIRYINLESLKHIYTGANTNVSLVVTPDGEVWIEVKANSATGVPSSYGDYRVAADLGFVINDGTKIVIDPDTKVSPWCDDYKYVENLSTLISGFVSKDNRTLFDDFSVKIADDHDQFQEAFRIWIHRRDAGR